jgi:hypothetical protein
VVWLARTYVVCGRTCPSAESRRKFGIGADDYVSSEGVTRDVGSGVVALRRLR